MRSFTTALKEHEAEQEDIEFPYEFELDGRVVTFRKPASGEATILTMALARHNSFSTKLASSLDIFFKVLDDDSREWLEGRLMDLDDDFDGMTLIGEGEGEGILYAMIEEWGGNPTQSSSTSAPRSSGAGTGSKQSTRKSTSSRSRSTSS